MKSLNEVMKSEQVRAHAAKIVRAALEEAPLVMLYVSLTRPRERGRD